MVEYITRVIMLTVDKLPITRVIMLSVDKLHFHGTNDFILF